MSLDFLPTADLATLRIRARILSQIREYFDRLGYLEVDTPLLSHDQVIDSNLEPLVVHAGFAGQDLFLQTSPEFAMKRLLVAGLGSIYQLGKVFRRAERGRRHNPEFTMVEWYGIGTDQHQQMDVTEALVRKIGAQSKVIQFSNIPFRRTTYAEAFQKYVGIDVFGTSTREFAQVAAAQQVDVPAGLEIEDRDGWLNLLLASLVEPHLGCEIPEFLVDYPASQAALARIRPGTPPHSYDVAERFELYIQGLELCNGYHELADPAELRTRIRKEWTSRDGAPPEGSRLLHAMEAGLPPCSGVALGVDRLIMIVAGKQSIDEVIPFPVERC
ncbi:MAG: epmA [Planctomycetaceae bacterium]|nr:epmA [Planctomycetaceae bacterium]